MRRVLFPPLVALLVATTPARADSLYHLDRVESDGAVIRAFASADLAPVEAVVRAQSTEAVRRAAPDVLAPRDLGTHRLRDLRLDVEHVRFTPGRSSSEVRIEVDAEITAEREDRSVAIRNYLPTFVYTPRGRVNVAAGKLVVRVSVAIANGDAVILRILGDRLEVEEPLPIAVDLERRVLHTHAQPIPEHPSIAGLAPEAAALLGIDGHTMRFVVRFRRTAP